MEMAERSTSLARRMWRGENAMAALTYFFFFCVVLSPKSRSVTDKAVRMGGTEVRRHCAKAREGILFQYCGWDLNRC